ncbi:MAG: hypothetical protein ACOC9X_03570 [bacterium]
MIRLTVLYNLKPHVDEEEFLRWRLTDHQEENLSIPGVIRADFCRVDQRWPQGMEAPYRFMATLDWPDRQSFEEGFYDAGVQAGLKENLELLSDPVFLISEILTEGSKEIDHL